METAQPSSKDELIRVARAALEASGAAAICAPLDESGDLVVAVGRKERIALVVAMRDAQVDGKGG